MECPENGMSGEWNSRKESIAGNIQDTQKKLLLVVKIYTKS
jgi:hypothetical protein